MITIEDRIREIEDRAKKELPVEYINYELIVLAICEVARQVARFRTEVESAFEAVEAQYQHRKPFGPEA